MDGEPRTRGTVALAIGSIVAGAAMLLTGAVVGQPDGTTEAAAVAAASAEPAEIGRAHV